VALCNARPAFPAVSDTVSRSRSYVLNGARIGLFEKPVGGTEQK